MAGKGGARAGAGRKKGGSNEATGKRVDVAIRALRNGITPLEYMLQVMRNPKASESRRDEMARAAAPFVHPRLSTHEVGGIKGGTPIAHEVRGSVQVFLPDNGRRNG